MVASDSEDSLTQLNTQLNGSMVLMDTNSTMDKSPKIKNKNRKSITINTSINAVTSSTPRVKKSEIRKGILKRKKIEEDEDEVERKEDERNVEEDEDSPDNERISNDNVRIGKIFEKPKQLHQRPHTLDEYIKNDCLIMDPTPSSFTIDTIDEDDELWTFDIPKTLNPHDLTGQSFYFGDKTKLKIGNERYLAITNDNSNECFTCIMGTGRETKRFKTVNIQPMGTIVIRKKLSNVGSYFSINDDDEQLNGTVPFPDNLKIRHPLKGVGKIDKRMKKFSPIKSRIKKRKSEISD